MHFNDILGVTASILIKSSGGNISDYLSSGELENCSSTGVYSVLAQCMCTCSYNKLTHTICSIQAPV